MKIILNPEVSKIDGLFWAILATLRRKSESRKLALSDATTPTLTDLHDDLSHVI
jgi:hypothetical protein